MTEHEAELARQMGEHPLSVMICTPTGSGKPDLDYSMSYAETYRLMLTQGIPFMYHVLRGDAFIDKARNRGVSYFLNYTNAQNLFFLDDDIGWPPEKFIEFLHRPEPVVVGAYPMKTEAGNFYPLEMTRRDGRIVEQKGLYLLNWGPTGFMRIKRSVLMEATKTADVYPEPLDHFGQMEMQYSLFEAGSFPTEKGAFWTDPFGREHKCRDWKGEDVYFCDRLRTDVGAEIWLDPNIEMTHRGGKQWRGNFSVDHAETIAANSPKARTAVERLFGDAA